MTTQLAIYNQVLIELGLRTLSSTTENQESRRVIDDVYDEVIAYCLESGQWNFAVRTVKIDSDTGIDPGFGYEEVFAKPTDWVRTVGISFDEYNWIPLIDSQYKDEAGNWLTDGTPIYARYISNGSSYGLDLDAWPESFTRYVVVEIAFRVVERLTQSMSKRDELRQEIKRAKRNALAKDAIGEGTRFPVSGRLVSVRVGADRSRYDRGNRSSLTG